MKTCFNSAILGYAKKSLSVPSLNIIQKISVQNKHCFGLLVLYSLFCVQLLKYFNNFRKNLYGKCLKLTLKLY